MKKEKKERKKVRKQEIKNESKKKEYLFLRKKKLPEEKNVRNEECVMKEF